MRPVKSPGNWLVSKKININMLEAARQKHLESYLSWISGQPQFRSLEKEESKRFIEQQSEQFLSRIDPIGLRAGILTEEFKIPPSGREIIKGLVFRDDGRKGDEKAGDGIYTATYIPKRAGSYSFDITASHSQKGRVIKREKHLQAYVRPKLDLKPFSKKFEIVENTLRGEVLYDIIFSLKDKYGNLPAPDDLTNLSISFDKGSLAGGLQDNMDGTFTQRISLAENLKPEDVTMTLSIDDRSESVKIRKGIPYQIIMTIALIIIVAAGFVMRRKRK